MIGLGIQSKGVTGVAPTSRWMLNSDPSHIIEITYIWDDLEAWDDTAVLKA